jgi:hypothetical protein
MLLRDILGEHMTASIAVVDELCKFTFSDLCVLPGGRYAIKSRFSKTDQEGNGKNNVTRWLAK